MLVVVCGYGSAFVLCVGEHGFSVLCVIFGLCCQTRHRESARSRAPAGLGRGGGRGEGGGGYS